MSSLSDLVVTTCKAYGSAGSNASKMLLKNWRILPGSVALYFTLEQAEQLISPFGVAGGFILGLVQVALLSLYYRWLELTVEKTKISWTELFEFDGPLYWSLLGVAFLLSIGNLVFHQAFAGSTSLAWIPAIFGLVVFVLFNPIAEVTYSHRDDTFPNFSSALSFVKENWIEWFLPIVVVLIPMLRHNPLDALSLISSTEVLLPIQIVLQSFGEALSGYEKVGAAITVIVGTWFMIFRGFLFQELSGSSRRKRAFALKQ